MSCLGRTRRSRRLWYLITIWLMNSTLLLNLYITHMYAEIRTKRVGKQELDYA
jgi:hypothetical protein